MQGLGTRVGEVELTNDIHMRRNIVDMIQLKISVKNVIAVTWVTKFDNQLEICNRINPSQNSFLVENKSFMNLLKISSYFRHFI